MLQVHQDCDLPQCSRRDTVIHVINLCLFDSKGLPTVLMSAFPYHTIRSFTKLTLIYILVKRLAIILLLLFLLYHFVLKLLMTIYYNKTKIPAGVLGVYKVSGHRFRIWRRTYPLGVYTLRVYTVAVYRISSYRFRI